MRGLVESCRHVVSRAQQSRPLRRLLLAAGIAAVVLYGIGDLVSGLLYEGYSWRDQAISELSAFGSPVRPLMASVIVVHAALITAFGVGVWLSAHTRSIRWAGLALVGTGLVGFPNHTVFAMSSRWMEGGFKDTMHIILSMVFVVFVAVAMVSSAVAFKGRFRVYAIATALVVIGFGAASGVAAGGMEQNLTPWMGGFERINAYAYFAWIVVLAVRMLRALPVQPQPPVIQPAPAARGVG